MYYESNVFPSNKGAPRKAEITGLLGALKVVTIKLPIRMCSVPEIAFL